VRPIHPSSRSLQSSFLKRPSLHNKAILYILHIDIINTLLGLLILVHQMLVTLCALALCCFTLCVRGIPRLREYTGLPNDWKSGLPTAQLDEYKISPSPLMLSSTRCAPIDGKPTINSPSHDVESRSPQMRGTHVVARTCWLLERKFNCEHEFHCRGCDLFQTGTWRCEPDQQ
jgi:hypothetical protein